MSGHIVSTTNGPLCPHSSSPQAPEHVRHVEVVNAMYDAADKDEDGEWLSPEAEAMYAVVSVRDHMRLYCDIWSGPGGWMSQGGPSVTVESWWWRCQVCGFVLPASRV